MRIKFLSVIVSFFLVSFAVTSCLDTEEIEYSPDATIHAFALDTIHGVNYKFTIDQLGPVHGIRVLLMYAYRNSILFGILHVGSPHFYSHRFLHSASEVDRIGIVEQSILTLCVFGSDYSGSCGQCLDKNTVNNCIGTYR